MALLRWIHLRRLVAAHRISSTGSDKGGGTGRRGCGPAGRTATVPAPQPAAGRAAAAARRGAVGEAASAERRRPRRLPAPAPADGEARRVRRLKDALLDEIQKTKKLFYSTVIAQAQRIACRRRPRDVLRSARAPRLQAAARAEPALARRARARGWRDVRSRSRAPMATARRPRKRADPARGGGQAAPTRTSSRR